MIKCIKKLTFKRWIELLCSLPKSFGVCVKLFGIKEAFKLQLIVRYNTKILGLNGLVSIGGGKRVLIGFGEISEFDKSSERSIIKFDGTIHFETPCWFGLGAKIVSEQYSSLTIGKNFYNTAKLTISNRGTIVIGEDCLVSWNTWICDTDFHIIQDLISQRQSNPNGLVKIGNKVWLAANCSVMKGASVPNGCIIGTGAIVNRYFEKPNCLLAGIPAEVKKDNISLIK